MFLVKKERVTGSYESITNTLSVIWLGLEPKTYCLEGSCSIQLSYQTEKTFSKNRLQR